ncbi:MAG TPA: DUF4112 domain-containing protein [Caulobacteraceae bacterium]|nr:DUF4112 domain-containing protein [Caulobacteraceae bacterium]
MTVQTVIEATSDHVPAHIREIWNQAELVKKLSDGLIRIGPWGLGLDGLLAFLPGANLVYGLGAGGVLVYLAIRAEASKGTIARMVAYLALDNATDAIPILGWAADALFTGHKMAANALQKDIERRYGPMREPKRRWWDVGPKKVGQGSAAGR